MDVELDDALPRSVAREQKLIQQFFDLVGIDLLGRSNAAYKHGRLSISQCRGLITLLTKETHIYYSYRIGTLSLYLMWIIK